MLPSLPLRSEDSERTLRRLRMILSGVRAWKRNQRVGRLTATSEMPASSIVKKNALVTASVVLGLL